MNVSKQQWLLIKTPYWLGIFADALWAVGLLFPPVFAILTGNPEFNPDTQTRLIMGMGGSLMMGWTFLLLWAVRKPVERRVVILLTAFPVVLGMLIIAILGFLAGNSSNIWLILKSIVLIVSMTASYILSCRIDTVSTMENSLA
ncbi:MAG: hypothetical protein V3W18_10950 [candidate division Zixibacteria bacterium]